MMPGVRKLAAELVRRTTRAQGLSLKVRDPRVLGRVAEVLGPVQHGGKRATP